MRSRANLRSHPIHPILVTFPIASFTGTLVFDLIGNITGNEKLLIASGITNLAGIISSVIAAIPGIIDYKYTVPPDSSAKKRAAMHGLLNTMVLLIFIAALWYRNEPGYSVYILIAMEVFAIILLSKAGWLGGTLVYRNQIGVDVRYADAGKWNEETVAANTGKIRVAAIDELALNQMKLIRMDGKRIVIGKTEDGYTAFDDHCTHRGGSLAGGSMMCKTVQCPWHGTQFDVETGKVKAGPALQSIKIYKCYQSGDSVIMEL